MGQSPDGSTYSDTPTTYILVQGNADLKDGWVFPKLWTTKKTKMAFVGDLIMSVRAPAGAVAKTKYNVVIGRGVARIKGSEFIYQSLVKKDYERFWRTLATGSTFDSINSVMVFNVYITVPPDIEEQKKIADYFERLDHLITLHQRECDYGIRLEYLGLWEILKNLHFKRVEFDSFRTEAGLNRFTINNLKNHKGS